ncbi:MAG: hypothetical protein ACFBSD_11515 [Paracoccaceae bacterium]
MTQIRFATPMVALALLGACAVPNEPAGFAPLGPDAVTGGGLFNTGGGLVVAAEAREIAGKTGVCGAWARSPQSVNSTIYNDDVLATGSIYLGGDRLVQGLDYLPEVPLGPGFAGVEARCVVTARPWTSGDRSSPVEIRLPRQVLETDGDALTSGSAGGITVKFRQVPVFDPDL